MYNHGFKAIYNENSKILILGSFPSVKSREMEFYYSHPSNRFWKLMVMLLDSKEVDTIEEKTNLLLSNNIALYDAVEQAEIIGSMDSDLNVVQPANLKPIIENSNIEKIFCNGNKSYEIVKAQGYSPIKLPSTSAANARYSIENLYEKWKIILNYI